MSGTNLSKHKKSDMGEKEEMQKISLTLVYLHRWLLAAAAAAVTMARYLDY